MDPNLPIALRPAVDFPPIRGSVFDDPGDEKSWHTSQRAEDLSQYYAGRDSSWYATAVAPLVGADRVLDLGCGPGLALEALRDQGSTAVLGVDRWATFVADSRPEAPIVAHDLSLPMPFLPSGSFDGVLSHYVLDYLSPICVRQVLREAHRVLAPGGLLVIYLAAIGLAGGDESRTVAYSPGAIRSLLAEAGFDQVDVTASSGGRNAVAEARRPAAGPGSTTATAQPRAVVEGDTQLSASFIGAGKTLTFELAGDDRATAFSIKLPRAQPGDDSAVSACARVQQAVGAATELQLWVWHGLAPFVAERFRVEFPVSEMRIDGDGAAVDHASTWRPDWLSLEPAGRAYVDVSELRAGGELDDAERGAEGRQIVVEAGGGPSVEVGQLGPGRNRFLIRSASRLDPAGLDREWLSAKLHGVAIAATELDGERRRDLLLWAGWRQSVLYLEGADWEGILATAERRQAEMMSPVVLVDPALGGDRPGPPPTAVAAFVANSDRFFLLLGRESLRRSKSTHLARVSRCLLLADPSDDSRAESLEAAENLRYLTERTLLMRLRQLGKRPWTEIGRRPA